MRTFIFVWFIASVIVLCSVFVLGSIWTGPSAILATWQVFGSAALEQAAKIAVLTLEAEGAEGLGKMETDVGPEQRVRVFVFGPALAEVRDQPSPVAVRSLAGQLQPGQRPRFVRFGAGLLAGTAASGRQDSYRVVFWFPSLIAPSLSMFATAWLVRLGLMVMSIALLSSWLAWRLAAPLAKLRDATRRFASGNLSARSRVGEFPRYMPEFTALAGDFDEMAARIESLVNAQRQLLRDVSHELRTPLTRLGLAVDNARAARPGEVDVCWNRIDQEAQRLNELIERILRLSRMESLRTSEHCGPIALKDFLESIVSDATFEASARQRNIVLEQVDTGRIMGDRELLREAIENVIRNAIRYTPPGSCVTVRAGSEPAGNYCITVRDQGPGVRPEHLDSIFEPFYRAPQNPAHGGPGFGVGLAIVKRAVTLHRGSVLARNLERGGFELTILLPLSPTG